MMAGFDENIVRMLYFIKKDVFGEVEVLFDFENGELPPDFLRNGRAYSKILEFFFARCRSTTVTGSLICCCC